MREALNNEASRNAERAREAADKASRASPAAAANPAAAQNAHKRHEPAAHDDRRHTRRCRLGGDAGGPGRRRSPSSGQRCAEGPSLDAVVFLNRAADGKPVARVWTVRATDDTVEDFIRDALKDANRKTVFADAGIDPAVVDQTDAFLPDVRAFSPKSQSGPKCRSATNCPRSWGWGRAFCCGR